MPPGAVLFISLRKGDVGPPAAARRIPGPRFPMTVSLSAADSMLGRPLPTDASVWARLDSDGLFAQLLRDLRCYILALESRL